MSRPAWITTDELLHQPDHAVVILQGRIAKTSDVVDLHGKRQQRLTFKDIFGSATVFADWRFEYALTDKELPVVVIGKKTRWNGLVVVAADSLNFPVPPSLKFKHVLAALENR